jgi:hypothetical protein
MEGPPATLEVTINRNNIGLLAEGYGKIPVRINAFLEGGRIPAELRGKDLFEDKSGTFFMVRPLKMYEILSHTARFKDSSQKLTLIVDGKDLRLRGVETLPGCLEN